MLPKSLVSLQHPFVKYLVKLRKERGFRREEKKVLVTGKNLIRELLAAKAPFEALLVEERCLTDFSLPSTYLTSAEVLEKITGLTSCDGAAALLSMPLFQNLSSKKRVLVLDGIADPGNLGTLLRSALAFNWDGVFLTENSCDPFNEKALRAAKGATFLLPLEEGSFIDFVTRETKRTILVADMKGQSLEEVEVTPPLALILSKEGPGARKEAKMNFQTVSIPMKGPMESLNVAQAGSIFLYTYRGS